MSASTIASYWSLALIPRLRFDFDFGRFIYDIIYVSGSLAIEEREYKNSKALRIIYFLSLREC